MTTKTKNAMTPAQLAKAKKLADQRAKVETMVKDLLWTSFLSECVACDTSDFGDNDPPVDLSNIYDIDEVAEAVGSDTEDKEEFAKAVVDLFKLDEAQEQTVTLKLTPRDRAKILNNVDDYCTSEEAKDSIRAALKLFK